MTSIQRARRKVPGAFRRMPVYHHDEGTRCPDCDRQQWNVGRVSAECAFCGAILPFAREAA
jgi:hypothetical protein